MKYFYYAVVVQENGKNFAYADKVGECLNICTRWANGNFIMVHQCETKKKAEELASYWNECYKKNGTYMLSDEIAF